ncbi:MAG: glycosyltransferase family 9 protein [Nanoarchaeota archaeon]
MKELSKKKKIFYSMLDFISFFLLYRYFRVKKTLLGDKFVPERILLIEFYGIGDLIILSGAIDPIKQKWPNAEIWILSRSFAKDIFGHDVRIKGVMTFDFPWVTWGFRYNFIKWPWFKFHKLIKKLKEIKFDLAFGRPDLPMNVILRLSNSSCTLGYKLPGGSFLLSKLLPPQGAHDHEGMVWKGYLDALNIPAINYTPRLFVNEKEYNQTNEIINKLNTDEEDSLIIGIHPGASHRLQRWPENAFRQLADILSKKAKVLWFLSNENIKCNASSNRNIIEVNVPLGSLCQLINKCDLFICNDSGPMHIAAALNRKVIAIFGPQEPRRFAPRNLSKIIVSTGYACRPCANKCIYNEPKCLNEIPVDSVLAAVFDLFPLFK